MKAARSRLINREPFVDWNKLMGLIHSTSLQLTKINLDKIRPGDASEKYQFRRGSVGRKLSIGKELDVQVERDFILSRKDEQLDIEFEEVEQPSLNAVQMSSGTVMKRKYCYRRSRLNDSLSSIAAFRSTNPIEDLLTS